MNATRPPADLLRDLHSHAASSVVDDTTALTGNREDAAIQTLKIDAFSTWAGTPINNSKCAMTAILHGEAAKRRVEGWAINPERLSSLLEHTAAFTIGNKPIPFLHPTKTYKYLGVHLCPAMNWEKQIEQTVEDALEKGRQLAASLASPRQCLHVLQTVIKRYG